MLTPNDVRHRKFRTYRSLLYGEVYDVEDVDDFLDLVASGHLTLLAVGQVLQRSLEPAKYSKQERRGNDRRADDR